MQKMAIFIHFHNLHLRTHSHHSITHLKVKSQMNFQTFLTTTKAQKGHFQALLVTPKKMKRNNKFLQVLLYQSATSRNKDDSTHSTPLIQTPKSDHTILMVMKDLK